MKNDDLQSGPPPGFRFQTDLIDPAMARECLAHFLARRDWFHDRFRGRTMKRGVISYGYTYLANGRRLVPAPSIPEPLLQIRARCAVGAGVSPDDLNQLIVTWYPSGAGIGPHTDAIVFGEVIVGVSLGGAATLRLRHGDRVYDQHLPHGSTYWFQGAARREWTHEICPVREDRYSLTYRSVTPEPDAVPVALLGLGGGGVEPRLGMVKRRRRVRFD